MSYFNPSIQNPTRPGTIRTELKTNFFVNANEFTKAKQDQGMFLSLSEDSETPVHIESIETDKQPDYKQKLNNIKQKKVLLYQNQLKFLDTFNLFLAISGLALAIFDFQYNFHTSNNQFIDLGLSNKFRIYISGSTAIYIILAIYRSIVSYKIYREKRFFLEYIIQSYFKSQSFIHLIIEICIVIVHCPPFINYDVEIYQLNTELVININWILCSYMMLRLILLFRLFLHHSKWSTAEVRSLCKKNQVYNPLAFALKASLKSRPQFLLIPTFGVITYGLGIAMKIYEGAYNKDNNFSIQSDYSYVYNCEWLILLTMTTVGYGDFYPKTHIGRFIAVLAFLLGTFLISLLIVMINNAVIFNFLQENSYKRLKKISDIQEMKKLAVSFIKSAIEIYLYKKHNKISPGRLIHKINQMNLYKKSFKQKIYDIKFKNSSFKDILIQLNQNFSHDLEKLKKSIKNATDLGVQLDMIIESQKKTIEVLLICKNFSREANTLII